MSSYTNTWARVPNICIFSCASFKRAPRCGAASGLSLSSCDVPFSQQFRTTQKVTHQPLVRLIFIFDTQTIHRLFNILCTQGTKLSAHYLAATPPLWFLWLCGANNTQLYPEDVDAGVEEQVPHCLMKEGRYKGAHLRGLGPEQSTRLVLGLVSVLGLLWDNTYVLVTSHFFEHAFYGILIREKCLPSSYLIRCDAKGHEQKGHMARRHPSRQQGCTYIHIYIHICIIRLYLVCIGLVLRI